MSTVLVTGGAGFIGSHTVVELAAAGHRPVVLDDFSNSDPAVLERLERLVGAPVAAHRGDFGDADLLRDVLAREQVDGVIHFAASKAVGESVEQPLRYYANNVGSFVVLLRELETAGVRHVVFSSSCTVYGQPDVLPVTEESPQKPATSPYGSTKQMAETVLRDAVAVSGSLNALALRYFNPVGAHPSALIGELPRGVPLNLVPFVTQTAAGLRDELVVHGDDYDTPDGSCVRDYIHVVDVAQAHVAALAHLARLPVRAHDVVNLGTGRGASVLEVLRTFEEVTGVPVPHRIGPRRPGDVVATWASVDKAREVLGWTASLTLGDALRDAWRWQQALAG